MTKEAKTGNEVQDDGVDLGSLAGYIAYNPRLAQSVSFRAFAASVGGRELRVGWFAARMLIHRNRGISQGALGSRLRLITGGLD